MVKSHTPSASTTWPFSPERKGLNTSSSPVLGYSSTSVLGAISLMLHSSRMGSVSYTHLMLKHAPLGDASPVEVREAQCVSGPLAVLDDYYGVYVTCPDDAQYRLDWIKEIYTPDMNNDYVYPNVFMSNEDTEQVSNLQADLQTYMNTQKANWIMNRCV